MRLPMPVTGVIGFTGYVLQHRGFAEINHLALTFRWIADDTIIKFQVLREKWFLGI